MLSGPLTGEPPNENLVLDAAAFEMGLFNSRGGAAKGPALFPADVVAFSGVIQPRTRKRLY